MDRIRTAENSGTALVVTVVSNHLLATMAPSQSWSPRPKVKGAHDETNRRQIAPISFTGSGPANRIQGWQAAPSIPKL
jgi:hypothetical protein